MSRRAIWALAIALVVCGVANANHGPGNLSNNEFSPDRNTAEYAGVTSPLQSATNVSLNFTGATQKAIADVSSGSDSAEVITAQDAVPMVSNNESNSVRDGDSKVIGASNTNRLSRTLNLQTWGHSHSCQIVAVTAAANNLITPR